MSFCIYVVIHGLHKFINRKKKYLYCNTNFGELRFPGKFRNIRKRKKCGSIGTSVKVQWPMFPKKEPAWLQLPLTRNPFSLLHYSWFQVQEVGRRINPKIPIARFPQRYANSIEKLNERNSIPRGSTKRKNEKETNWTEQKEEASGQQELRKLPLASNKI